MESWYSALQWHIDKPERIGGFRWSLIPKPWWDSYTGAGDDPIEAALLLVLSALWSLEWLLVRPTVGVVRLVIHHRRSPGWYVRVMYTQVVCDGVGDYTVDFGTRRKGQAKRVARALRRELRRTKTLNLGGAAIQAAVVANQATGTVVSNIPPRTRDLSAPLQADDRQQG
ncbi:MAG TPA: hypothetical protein VF444_23490 [Pseudonocardiaceae bacterium]